MSKSDISADSSLANLARERVAREVAQHQRKLLKQLKGLLEFWDNTFCREVELRKREYRKFGYVWPTKEDLAEFDDLLFQLVYTIRKRAVPHEKAVAIVNSEWPQLHLNQIFSRKLTSQILPSNEGATRFREILDRAEKRKLTMHVKFLKQHSLVVAGKPGRVPWSKFRSLFCEKDGSFRLTDRLVSFPSNSDGEVYAKYLELYSSFLQSLNDRNLYLKKQASTEPLVEWVDKMELRETHLATAGQHRKRTSARNRKKRERARKKASQKPVTNSAIGSLADIRLSE